MPRYFFNYRRNGRLIADEEGSELASDQMARDEAVVSAREMLANGLKTGRRLDENQFEIADSSGALLFVVPFNGVLLK